MKEPQICKVMATAKVLVAVTLTLALVSCVAMEPDRPSARQTAVVQALTAIPLAGNAATRAPLEQTVTAWTVETRAEAQAALAKSTTQALATAKAGEECTRRIRSGGESPDYSKLKPGADLAGCDLHGLSLFGLDLSQADLSFTNLSGADLQNTKLDRANLSQANLLGANLMGARMRDADLGAALIEPTNLQGIDLGSASLADAVWNIWEPTPQGSWGYGKVEWSPDSMQFALVGQETRVWDARTGKVVSASAPWIVPVDRSVRAASPDGDRVALPHGDEVQLYDTKTGALIAALASHQGYADALAWSPDGKRLAASGEFGKVTLWDVETSTETAALEGHRGLVFSLSWSPDGARLASAGEDRMVRVWNTRTGANVATLIAPMRTIWSVAWSPDGSRLAAFSDNGLLRVWPVAALIP
jgi:WD40 repeat protein